MTFVLCSSSRFILKPKRSTRTWSQKFRVRQAPYVNRKTARDSMTCDDNCSLPAACAWLFCALIVGEDSLENPLITLRMLALYRMTYPSLFPTIVLIWSLSTYLIVSHCSEKILQWKTLVTTFLLLFSSVIFRCLSVRKGFFFKSPGVDHGNRPHEDISNQWIILSWLVLETSFFCLSKKKTNWNIWHF